MTLEVFETARELGYHAVCLLLDEGVAPEGVESLRLADAATRVLAAPIFLADGLSDPRDVGLRYDERVRRQFDRSLTLLRRSGFHPSVTLIHPTAHVSPTVTLGLNVFVGPLVTISSESKVADFARVGRGASIGHHVTIGQGVQVGPGVTLPGGVEIRDGAILGPGVVTLNGVIIGARSMVGAGSVVTSHVRPGFQVIGNPARPIRGWGKLTRRFLRRTTKLTVRRLGFYNHAREWFRRTKMTE